ncbi:protein translocase subunit SecF [Thalassotalea marina]|uniref:Protein-export membrane protein SecF n=1 Tax=Thalassotalea marina TaxID=1673741 RepID=A0A919EQN1_9GAMM|nr:protein translocase subunit SecF [Thalassotalea marina]GHG08097.1 protein-export membrane protein SecF [Thalassotalea marina]
MSTLSTQFTEDLSKVRLFSLYAAVLFVFIALLGLFTRGLNLGLDFTGGYLTEFSTERSIAQSDMDKMLSAYLPGSFQVSSAENGTYWTLRQADNVQNTDSKIWLTEFAQQNQLNITPQDSMYIGSQIGEELINQGGLALLTATVAILLYLSLRFEWRLAMGCLVALFHDVIVVLGVFSWFGLSFDLTILASLLALIGYSLNDSIIVGDKMRELMRANDKNPLESIINAAIKSTLVRTMITSGTTLATILAIWFFAGESLKGFAVALFTGIIVGTYSSIALSATIPQLLGLKADHYQQKEEEILCDLP